MRYLVRQDERKLVFVLRDADKADAESLATALLTLSLVRPRLVVVRQVEKLREEAQKALLSLLEDLPDDTHAVLTAASVDLRRSFFAELKSRGVEMMGSVNYEQIGDQGLLVSYGEKRENATWLDVDNIILCAGQLPLREWQEPLVAAGMKVTLLGGADVASELDAKRAINQASRVAAAA